MPSDPGFFKFIGLFPPCGLQGLSGIPDEGFFAFLIWLCWVLAVARGLLAAADQGSNLGPRHWEHGVRNTGLPGNSPDPGFLNALFSLFLCLA